MAKKKKKKKKGTEGVCPNCDSVDVNCGVMEWEDGFATVQSWCDICDATWTNEYKVTYIAYHNLVVPEPESKPKVLGYWVTSAPDGVLMKWGTVANAKPYTLKSEAVEQVDCLQKSEIGPTYNSPFYILTVFDNGQILTEEIEE